MILTADLGGTKTILAIAQVDNDAIHLASIIRFDNRAFASFEEVLRKYLAETGATNVSALCIGAAGAVTGNRVRITNLGWTLDGDSLARDFSIGRVMILNDLVAAGYGLEHLQTASLEIINSGRPQHGGNRVLLSPGTGLGVTIVPYQDGRYVPAASEGGHAAFAPFDGLTRRLWEYMRKAQSHVPLESVLSGPGLGNLYRFLAWEQGYEIPAETEHNLADDSGRAVGSLAMEQKQPLAASGIRLFLDILASAAGNLALVGTASGGVYIGGGIVPRLKSLIDKDRFMALFSDKGVYHPWLATFPVTLICDTDLPLYGAANCARQRR